MHGGAWAASGGGASSVRVGKELRSYAFHRAARRASPRVEASEAHVVPLFVVSILVVPQVLSGTNIGVPCNFCFFNKRV